ncbi:MAG: hypothetical protein ACRDE8_11900, partial [Ginsengibacter sp.]
YWIKPQQILSAEAGSHRFIWDLHYTPLNLPASYPIAAIYKNTAPAPTSPWIMPGNYTIKLQVNGQSFSRPLVIKMDPRIKTSFADLQKQHDFSVLCYEGRLHITKISKETVSVHNQIKDLIGKAQGSLHTSLRSLDEKVTNIENAKPHDKLKSFNDLYNSFVSSFNLLQESDMSPTSSTIEAVKSSQKNLIQLEKTWMKIKTVDIPEANSELKKAGFPSITIY